MQQQANNEKKKIFKKNFGNIINDEEIKLLKK